MAGAPGSIAVPYSMLQGSPDSTEYDLPNLLAHTPPFSHSEKIVSL